MVHEAAVQREELLGKSVLQLFSLKGTRHEGEEVEDLHELSMAGLRGGGALGDKPLAD